ncbi:MFS transporter [Burkholderia multivorans]|jgi:MHS family citrate/tricarballylate:H+ symporter-like MFS transporter|uniref:MFS transporter n=1 Tax=Burkholderia multivorans TaxID=87883 RepID=UPI00057FCC3E|nr:MFS transporter [Burkholderia multivorans]KHS10245.1 citrate-proton symporter [Burkholderia multivorans]KHS14762.1 citrate-proton symporter [Burkholderia multivorans]MBR7923571.1 MFS transporter [Burkholderia multivorans]MBR8105029.1 MFS transporter [Burkholderia multivorans]MBU9429126.1 MFS transporter [Burkholderia multivorans]
MSRTEPIAATSGVSPMTRAAAVLRVTSGNFIEQFDFFLFGFYATSISKIFFPSDSEFASLMLTFAVFGAGFLMRPLGAIFLGAYIDKVGRRTGLIVTLSIMASGTILIACVPGYASIGLLAPVLVLLGRLLQGFSAGAELGGVSVYLAEMATPGNKGFYTSWQSASQQVAIVMAAAIGYGLNQWLSAQQIGAWGWRVPFFIGCAIVPFLFLLRRSLQETAAFEARRHHPQAREIFTMLLGNWRIVIGGMLLTAMTTTTFYLITVYTPTFGRSVLKLSTSDSLMVTLLVAASNFIWLPIGGAISDRIGRKPLLVAISVLAIFTAYPALFWLADAPSFARMLIVLLWFSFFFGMYNGAMVAALTEVMPVEVRVAGFSLAFSLATALFGGFTPAVSTYLIQALHDKAAPGYWLSFAALCGLGATLALYRRRADSGVSAASSAG